MSFCRPLSRNILQPLTRGTFLKSTSPSSSIAVARTFASVVPDSDSTAVALENTNNGASRPHLNIPVDPNHGLYGFFRKTEKDGVVKYETIDAKNPLTDKTGRSWTAPELRRKSFKDLHTLWYVLLRERNLLATQNEEVRRMGSDALRTPNVEKAHRVRKSMARIKYVINERRLAYEGAVQIHEERRLAALAERKARNEAIAEATAEKATKEAQADAKAVEGLQGAKAARLAAAALFDAAPVSQGRGSEGEKKA